VTTIVDLLRDRAASRPEVEAYRFLRDGEGSPETRSWADLDRRARAIGATLRERGAAGTNVLMLYPPGIDFIDGYFGCLYAGAVPVPAYPPEPARLQRTLPRVQAIVADAGAKFALSTKSLLALAEMVFAFAPDLRALSWLATDTLDRAAADAWSRPDITHEALAMLQYTSGSTGTPKGVMLSHANMLANAASVVSAFEVTPEDRWFSWLPVFHDMGFMQGVLQPLYSGCPVTAISPTAFLERPFRWLAGISNARATLSGSPNFGYDLCVRKTTPEQRDSLDLSCWKLAFNGAETVRLDTIERFAEMFAPAKLRRSAMFPCYGLAEATLIVSGNGRDAEPIAQAFSRSALEEGRVEARADGQVLVASGGIVAGAAVAIVDPEQRVRTAADRIGEIWVAGGSVGRGYWNRPDDTAATFGLALPDDPRRYMRTGDLGFLRDGQLYVCGRVKDVIIVRGANHYPQDIELTVERASAAIRPGCVAAFAFTVDGEERVAVVAEIDRRFEKDRRGAARTAPDRRSGEPSPRLPDPAAPPRPDTEPLDVDRLFWEIREAIGAAHELDPYAVVLVRAGSIHKTSSGKLQRRACRAAFDKGELEVLAEWRSDGTKRHSDVASKPRTRSPSSAPVAPAGAPVADAAQIDLAALRRPAVIVVARSVEIAESLSNPRFEVREADRARAIAGNYAMIVSDDLALLGEVAAARPSTMRMLVTSFDDPDAVRGALATGVAGAVVSATAGKQQLVAAAVEQVDAWVARETDLATSAIEKWLATWLAQRLGLNPKAIDLDAPVGGYGFDSLAIVEVQTALADWLRQEVPATLVRGRSSIRTIARRLSNADVSSRARSARASDDLAVAIVGMGCSLPGARDVSELRAMIAGDSSAIARVPEDRIHPDERTRWGAAIDHVTEFDAACFGMSPRDAATVDPQVRVLLETTWQALEHAGISAAQIGGTNAGVFVGISGSDFLRARPDLSITDRTSAAANRVSYFFNLRGPSFAVDSGDTSSLIALELAAASLQRGECDLAIVAGVNLTLSPDSVVAYGKAKLLATDGVCRPFDARAQGTVLADGCGVVILRRLHDARAASDRICAHLLAVAVGQNGRGHGLTAPSEAAQERVIREAIQTANVPAASVGYVELNARSLTAFDTIEARALANALGTDRADDHPFVVGALKANLGDTRAAAGILGVIKAAIVLEADARPRLLNLLELAPEIATSRALLAPREAVPWPAGERRIACGDNFGLLGTNAVAVLAGEPPAPPREPSARPLELLCLSARSEDALRTSAARYAAALAALPDDALADVCFTANLGRTHFAQRAALMGSSLAQLRDQLGALAAGDIQAKRALGRGAARIAFLCTSTPAQRGTARSLYEHEPRFRATLERCDRAARELLGASLVDVLYGEAERRDAREAAATVAIEIALSELWQSWGIHPDVVLGHAVGEYAAAAVVGALTFEQAIRLACGATAASAPRTPSIPMISASTGMRVVELDATWQPHSESAQVERGVKELVRSGIDVFLELGVDPVLTRRYAAAVTGPGVWLPSLDPGVTGDSQRLVMSLGALYERGISPHWNGVYANQSRARITLPGYPFERRRCWPDD